MNGIISFFISKHNYIFYHYCASIVFSLQQLLFLVRGYYSSYYYQQFRSFIFFLSIHLHQCPSFSCLDCYKPFVFREWFLNGLDYFKPATCFQCLSPMNFDVLSFFSSAFRCQLFRSYSITFSHIRSHPLTFTSSIFRFSFFCAITDAIAHIYPFIMFLFPLFQQGCSPLL